MNALTHRLELQCPVGDIYDSLLCLTHSILFQRLIGRAEPEVVDSTALKVSYPRLSDPEVADVVLKRVTEYATRIRTMYTASPATPDYPPYTVRLYAVSPGSTILGPKKTLFEMWTIAVTPLPPSVHDVAAAAAVSARLTSDIEALLEQIIRSTCEAVTRDYLPPLSTAGRGFVCNIKFEAGLLAQDSLFGRFFKHFSGEKPGI